MSQRPDKVCSVEGCDLQVRQGGKCYRHCQTIYKIPPIQPKEGNLCGVDGCDRSVRVKGYCMLHYDRVKLTGSPGVAMPTPRIPRSGSCAVEGCRRPVQGRGFCGTHYARHRIHGDAGGPELQRRRMGEGSITDTGYRIIVVNGKYVYEHRHVLEQKLGRPLRKGEQAHHRDGDKLNNRAENIELWSTYQPSGQRVMDKVASAIALLRQHPEFLRDEGYVLVALESAESSYLAGQSKDQVITLSEAVRGLLSE